MIKINSIALSPEQDTDAGLLQAVCEKLKAGSDSVTKIKKLKRSVDARKKSSVKILYSVAVEVQNQQRFLRSGRFEEYKPVSYRLPAAVECTDRPIVCGSGPAGLMAALVLARCGAAPIVLERGDPVEERVKKVARFAEGGEFDSESNIQFGEGGAGTFSDGKLTTGIKDPRMSLVLEEFVRAGAPDDILWQSKPHIGTDKLVGMVSALRREIIELGGEVRFNTRLTDVVIEDGAVTGAVVMNNGQESTIACTSIILATGHSARDTFYMLRDRGAEMQAKPFSVGARIEHPQSMINRAQYGDSADKGSLGAADYKLAMHLPSGRGVYTFCMCPGGTVVAAASEENSVVTNGMSVYARDGENANSALLVAVGPEDFGSDDVLAGVEFQRKIERAAYTAAGSCRATAQKVGDFLADRPSDGEGSVRPSYRPAVRWGRMEDCLPEFVAKAMREGIKDFAAKLKGFDLPDAVLTAPETRSSSPVRIIRGENLQSNIKGLYPCGEGAGYAGGIMSAAVDGIRCAEAVLEKYR